MDLNRRQFLKTGVAGLSALAFAPASRARAFMLSPQGGSGRVAVIVNRLGGNDHLNEVVPRLGNPAQPGYVQRRPTVALSPGSELPLDPVWGLNPALPQIHALWQQGRMSIIQKVGYSGTPDLSHFNSMDVWSSGYRDLGSPDARTGWLARVGQRHFTQAIEIAGIGTGNRLDFQGTAFKPAVFANLQGFDYPRDPLHIADAPLRLLAHQDPLRTPLVLRNFERKLQDRYVSTADLVDQVRQAVQNYPGLVTYPNESLANALRDVARLVHADLGTRIFYVQLGGWDHHSALATAHPALLARVDAAIDAFLRDLTAMNLYEKVLIIMLSEFGRRHFENAAFGTDHGHGNHMYCFGSGVRPGFHGDPVTAADIQEAYLGASAASRAKHIDFRIVMKEALSVWLGLDMTGIFPENELPHPGHEHAGSSYFRG